ncbi:MAG TPA: DUF488 domain-containing protein [bacterium]
MPEGEPAPLYLPHRRIYTVGHSNQSLETFLAMLDKHDITHLVDIRSIPYSSGFPWFQRDALARTVRDLGIDYRYLGDKLGGRPENKMMYFPDGTPDYVRIRQLPFYRAGINELFSLMGGPFQVCLMCAEEDPDHCHRKVMLGPSLRGARIEVVHLRSDQPVPSDKEVHEGEAGPHH